MTTHGWIAKPNGLVKAETPEDLAHQHVIVYPWSLTRIWGERAASRYMKAQGMSDAAIREVTEHHKKSRHPEEG